MTRRVSSLPQSRGKLLLLAAGLAASAVPVFGQAALPAQSAATAKPLAYEAVSIKPHKASAGAGMQWRTTLDGLLISGTPLKNLVMGAYDLVMPDQIVGLPGWADSDLFDIQAKMDEDAAAAMQKLPRDERGRQQDLMLQSILADRFQLKVHHEAKELPVYYLVIAKDGLKMKPAVSDPRSGWVVYENRISGKSVPIDNLLPSLSNFVGRFVVNKTGLTGNYAIELKWTPDGEQETADSGPSLFTALEEQLGLKLVPSKGPVDVIVVDHVERPSEN